MTTVLSQHTTNEAIVSYRNDFVKHFNKFYFIWIFLSIKINSLSRLHRPSDLNSPSLIAEKQKQGKKKQKKSIEISSICTVGFERDVTLLYSWKSQYRLTDIVLEVSCFIYVALDCVRLVVWAHAAHGNRNKRQKRGAEPHDMFNVAYRCYEAEINNSAAYVYFKNRNNVCL